MRKHSTALPRASRFALVLAVAAALVVPLTVAASAPGAPKAQTSKQSKKHKRKKRKAHKASFPMSGIYDACAYNDPKQTPLPNCDDRLAVLHAGGFQVVLNYWSNMMSVEDNVRYADQAAALGMRVIWNLSAYRGETIGPKLDLVSATMNHPGTWGYYIGDEVRPEDRDEVVQLSRAVKSMTSKPLLYVSRPNRALLKPFRKLADYVGPDSYPVGPIDGPICPTARWASKAVQKKKRNLAMVLQAYSWSIDFADVAPQWPSAGQMRQMRNQAMRCGRPKLIMWFAFHAITDYNPDPDNYWRQLAWAANGVNVSPNYRMG
jgi:hypothetical protein